MTRNKPSGKKIKLAKLRKHTKWAPFWIIPKKMGTGAKVHPSAVSRRKRSWRRDKTKV